MSTPIKLTDEEKKVAYAWALWTADALIETLAEYEIERVDDDGFKEAVVDCLNDIAQCSTKVSHGSGGKLRPVPKNCDGCDGLGFYTANAHGPQEITCEKCKGTGVATPGNCEEGT